MRTMRTVGVRHTDNTNDISNGLSKDCHKITNAESFSLLWIYSIIHVDAVQLLYKCIDIIYTSLDHRGRVMYFIAARC